MESLKRFMVQDINRGGSRTAATSKMELFVIIVNGFEQLTIITKCFHAGAFIRAFVRLLNLWLIIFFPLRLLSMLKFKSTE